MFLFLHFEKKIGIIGTIFSQLILHETVEIRILLFFGPKNWEYDFIFGSINIAIDRIIDPSDVWMNIHENRWIVVHVISIQSDLIDWILSVLIDGMHKWIAIAT